jgi:hypothetical protein
MRKAVPFRARLFLLSILLFSIVGQDSGGLRNSAQKKRKALESSNAFRLLVGR